MTIFEFERMVGDILATFGKSKLPKASMDRYYDKARNIPAQHIKAITEKIEDRESFPNNLGLAILSAYYELNGGTEREKKAPCPHCDDDGVIWVFRYGQDGRMTTTVAMCRNCRPGHQHATSKQELQAQHLVVANTPAELKELLQRVHRDTLAVMQAAKDDYLAKYWARKQARHEEDEDDPIEPTPVSALARKVLDGELTTAKERAA